MYSLKHNLGSAFNKKKTIFKKQRKITYYFKIKNKNKLDVNKINNMLIRMKI